MKLQGNFHTHGVSISLLFVGHTSQLLLLLLSQMLDHFFLKLMLHGDSI